MDVPLTAEVGRSENKTSRRISVTAMSLLDDNFKEDEWMSLSMATSGNSETSCSSGNNANIACRGTGVYEMTGFLCNDLSGHARLNLDLQLTCSSYKFVKQSLFDSKVLPLPSKNDDGIIKDKKEGDGEEDTEEEKEATEEENGTPLWEKELQYFSKDQSSEADDTESFRIMTKKKILQKQHKKTKFQLQCDSISSNNNDVVVVEQVSVLETFWMENENSNGTDEHVNSGFSIGLKVQVLMQATTNNNVGKTKSVNKTPTEENREEENTSVIPDHSLEDLNQQYTKINNDENGSLIKTNLSFTATLSRPSSSSPLLTSKTVLQSLQQSSSVLSNTDDDEQDDDEEDDVALGFAALDMANNSCLKSNNPYPVKFENDDSTNATQKKNLLITNMHVSNEDHTIDILTTSPDTPLVLKLLLVPALTLKIQEIGAPRAASGATLVNLIIQHSNLHASPVTVTNLALHPGHVRMLSPHVQQRPMINSKVQSSYHRQDDNENYVNISRFQRGISAGAHDDTSVMTFPSQLVQNNHTYPTSNPLSVHSSINYPHFPARPSSIANISTSGSSYLRMLRNSITFDTDPITVATSTNKAISGGEASVMDMSRNVRWAYAPGTALSFPFILKPYEAIATVLQIDAVNEEDWQSGQTFLAPLALTAFCGELNHTHSARQNEQLLVSADIKFTTAPSIVMAATNDDAFRVDMALRDPDKCPVVGAPVIVSLRVTNLSNDAKDLMLLMAKDEDRTSHNRNTYHRQPPRTSMHRRPVGNSSSSNKSNSTNGSNGKTDSSGSQQKQTVHTAVVSEVNGYTFGVWGLLSNNSALHDDGTLRYHRDHELLAVDAALLLGEVKSNQTMDAELRFVPLREGTLDIPNLKLYDKVAKRWYSCVHMLKIVAAAGNATTTTNESKVKK